MTKDFQTMRDRSWNFEPDELLYAYVGQSYSWSDMDQIVADKSQQEARHVAAMLELAPVDTVLDIGSGFGHVALGLAPHVARYVCADISEAMMEQCRKFTAGIANVAYEIFPRPHILGLAPYQPNKIFSNSVFIHMTMFEIVYYLRQVQQILPPGGLFYFNFNDSDYLAGAEDGYFEDMLGRWTRDPLEITLMHWNSFQSIRGIAQRIGLELKTVKKAQWGATSVTLFKL